MSAHSDLKKMLDNAPEGAVNVVITHAALRKLVEEHEAASRTIRAISCHLSLAQKQGCDLGSYGRLAVETAEKAFKKLEA